MPNNIEQKSQHPNFVLGKSKQEWTKAEERNLNSLGFDGKRVTLLKYLAETDGKLTSPKILGCEFGCPQKIWEKGRSVIEVHSVVDNKKQLRSGLYAYAFTPSNLRFLSTKHKPLAALVEMDFVHFLNLSIAPQQIAVKASTFQVLDITDKSLGRNLTDMPLNELSDAAFQIGYGARTWDDVNEIIERINQKAL